MVYGEPIAVEKKPADQITHDDLRTLTDRVTMEIQKMSGQEYVNEYAQKVKEQLKAQKAAEQANSWETKEKSPGTTLHEPGLSLCLSHDVWQSR